MKRINISVGDKIATLKIKLFDDDDEIDIDSLLRIDYQNLIAELLTFPVIVNRIGILLADMDNAVAEAKLSLEVYEAKKRERLRDALTEQDDKGKLKKPTVDELNVAVINDKGYQALKKKQSTTIKERDYINSIFWAAKDKSAKLDKLSLTIKVGDVEDTFLPKAINGIEIRFKGQLIK